MKFLCVKVGTKYPAVTVNHLYNKICGYYSGEVDFYCLTDNSDKLFDSITPIYIDPKDRWKKLQWHKTTFFRKNFNGFKNGEEVIVCDIDMDIISNIDELVDYPVKNFAASRRWWMLDHGQLSGSWYKFRIGEHYHVDSDLDEGWQEYWVHNRLVEPPVNGEQNWVERCIDNIEYFPDTWFTKWTDNNIRNNKIEEDFHNLTGEMLTIDGEFHDNIKVVHNAGYGIINSNN